MEITGGFDNKRGCRVKVTLKCPGDGIREIGIPETGIYFTTTPVTIESSVNDTFDALLPSSATIGLLVRNWIPELFTGDVREVPVTITVDGRTVFAGYVEPQTYSQPYNDVLDELTVNCIDMISALQYPRYADIGSVTSDYNIIKGSARMRSFGDIICDILTGIAPEGITPRILYDGSRSRTDGGDIFGLSVSELLFLGDNEDDVWTQQQVIEEIMRYLNLHLSQDGTDFRIFDWRTLMNEDPTEWTDLISGESEVSDPLEIVLTNSNVEGTDTQISVGETFNRISVRCDVRSMERVIESPLDSASLTSPYTNKQKYMTEMSSDGEGTTAFNAFYRMVSADGAGVDYEHAVMTDWYVRVRDNRQWVFPIGGNVDWDIISDNCTDNSDQQKLPQLMATIRCAALVSFGKVERRIGVHEDNSPVSRVEMEDWLAVSVNGNGNNSETGSRPNEEDLRGAAPVAVYRGNASGGVYSPVDESVTNYIVISGKAVLNPVMEESASYTTLRDHSSNSNDFSFYIERLVPSRDNGDGRFYTRKWWKATTPRSTPEWDRHVSAGLLPFTGTGPELYEFKYSAIGDGTDTISKVAVLACMLIIGDKCVVETGTSGTPDDFEWRPYKSRDECLSDDEYYAQSFTIGIDPKLGDKLIGTEYDIQNNIDYTMGIDAEGTAIPIRQSDSVSGAVTFMILGPVNTMWDEITRRHSTWFRHTKWKSTSVPLLAHVSAILIKSFEVKVYSDNGLIDNTEEKDLLYMSDTRETFVNERDDITMRFTSALTIEECRELGVSDSPNLSTPTDPSTGSGVTVISDNVTGETAKPEQLYVDAYWREYSTPRVEMTQSMRDGVATLGYNTSIIHPAMKDKKFYVIGANRDLMEGITTLKLKERWL